MGIEATAENFRYKRLLETGDFLFEKNINEITSEDIDNLIQRSIGESETLELKKDLPTKGNRPDPWYDGNGIGDYARNKLLTEVIAFANSFGGILLLGIEETAEAPPRASAVNLIPRCSELALRLEQQAGTCIEPQIPGMRVRGVPYDEDDNGIVLFMINRSTYLAPHPLKQTLHCYTRRGERTEELTMREIRDLVLTTRNLTDYIEQNFQKGADQFETRFARVKKVNENVRAFSVTAVPLDPDRVNLDIQKEVELPQNAFRGVGQYSNKPVEAQIPIHGTRWRHMIRGMVGKNDEDNELLFRVELHNNGMVQVQFFVLGNDQKIEDDPPATALVMFSSWLAAVFVNACMLVEILRGASKQNTLEYGLEARWHSDATLDVFLQDWHDRPYDTNSLGRHMNSNILFPQYVLGSIGKS